MGSLHVNIKPESNSNCGVVEFLIEYNALRMHVSKSEVDTYIALVMNLVRLYF